MNTYSLTRSVPYREIALLKFPRIILRLFWIISFILVTFSLIFYVFQVNAEVSERYLIQKYEQKLSEVLKENQNLEISSVQASSLDDIMVLMEGLNFEKVDKIHYIRVLGNQIVTK